MAAYQRRMEHLFMHLLRLCTFRLHVADSPTDSYSTYCAMSYKPPSQKSSSSWGTKSSRRRRCGESGVWQIAHAEDIIKARASWGPCRR